MAGKKRSIEFYIQKFGEELGTEKFSEMLKRRNGRALRNKNGSKVISCGDPERDIVEGNAIRCQACGYIGITLQWTHFKNKCSVKTIQDYKEKYPGYPLQSPCLVNLTKVTLQNLILKYGEEDGKRRWKVYCDKQAEVNTFEYKAKKFGYTKEDFDEFNASRAVTFENLVKRHGAEHGSDLWKSYCERQKYTNSMDYFVEKYGEHNGKEQWLEYNKEKSKAHTPQWIAEKYGVSFDEALIILSERRNISSVAIDISSETEKHFVNALCSALGYDPKYTYKTRQYCLWNEISKSANFFDVCCRESMKIIEYCGDYWHANPLKYAPDYVIKQKNKTAKEIWEDDYNKIMTAQKAGFTVKVIWESDYFENGICDALAFLKGE